MPRSLIPGGIAIALSAFVLVGFFILPGAYDSLGKYGAEALGLAWIFAIWGDLVAAVIFFVMWTTEAPMEWTAKTRGEPISLGRGTHDSGHAEHRLLAS